MEWIRTGIQIGNAVKNVQRLRQIVGTFAKYGFADTLHRMNLGKFLPGGKTPRVTRPEVTTPQRVRLAFEELGPAFVKFGQLLSTRSDVVPEAYVAEFTKLQDNVQPLPFEKVREAVERELRKPLREAFASFEERPLAAASIGQVHEARLHSGEVVVVKVQRPEIEKTIETDISLLAFLTGLMEKYVPESRPFNLRAMVDEFFRTLVLELDFAIEANNMVKCSRNLAQFTDLVIPKVYRELSTHRVLTLQKVEGIRINDFAALEAAGVDKKVIVDLIARVFFKAIMVDGLFHADIHGGNLFVMPGNRLALVDFGIVGRLSERSRDQLANMVVALLTEDYEKLCYQYAELGASGPTIDFEGFHREVRQTLSPYLGLSLEELNAGKILIEATRIAVRYNIKVPGDWMLIFKALVSVEGLGRELDPDFDLLAVGQDLVKDLLKNQYSMQKFSKDVMWVAKDAAALLQILPRQVRWMFRKFNSNDFALEIKSPDVEKMRGQLEVVGKKLSSSILAAGLFIASSLALQHSSGPMIWNQPLLAVLYFLLGCFLLLRLFL